MSQIHPTAIVEKGATIGCNVVIEPYATVKKNVTLKDGVTIKSYAYIDGFTTIGEKTVVYPSASIGTQTQAKNYRGEKTFVTIGKNCQIREFVTINASFEEGSTVEVGDDCLIMAYCHVAHHCKVGNCVTMANGVMFAGYVEVEDHVTIGGMTAVHQFVRIGAHAMVGGFSRVTNDIPPYTLGAGSPYQVAGLNLVGLKRHQFSLELRNALAKAFRLTYRSGLHLPEALQFIENEVQESVEIKHWIDFCKRSKRGLIGFQSVETPNASSEFKDLFEE